MSQVADDDPRWRQSEFGYGCNAAGRMDPPPRSLARRSVWLLHGRDPMWVQPNTSVVRAIARGQWQAPLGSSRGRPPDHGQPAAVLASVKDKPSAARVEQKNGELTTRDKNGVMHPW